MSLSERDRDYMRRLGEFQSEGHRAAASHWDALDPATRVERSIEMCMRDPGIVERRVDDPTPFYERARALGLYRP